MKILKESSNPIEEKAIKGMQDALRDYIIYWITHDEIAGASEMKERLDKNYEGRDLWPEVDDFQDEVIDNFMTGISSGPVSKILAHLIFEGQV